MKITKNFSYWEFGPKGCSTSWVPDNGYQKKLIDSLAHNLQIVRDKSSKKISIHITNGIRTIEDYYRLQGSGYHPSSTSDHFFGSPIPLSPKDKKYQKFGSSYIFSVGAVDCVCKGIPIKDFFEHSMRCYKDWDTNFGQVIYEVRPDTKVEWVHFSNHPDLVFNETICMWIERKPFLKSLDGGKTYTIASTKG